MYYDVALSEFKVQLKYKHRTYTHGPICGPPGVNES